MTDVPQSKRSALHLAVSDACNNSCVFCLNGRVDGRIEGAPPAPPSWDEIRDTIDQGRAAGLRELAITVAEPTLSPNLVPAIRHARSIGFDRVTINTNGRLLGRGRLVEDLVEAGLTTLMLSVHGPSAEVHDPLVRRPGAFVQVEAGLERLAAVRPATGFRLEFLMVLCRSNIAHLDAMWRFFSRFARTAQGDGLNCTAMKPLGCADPVYEALGLRYGELVDEWLRVWRGLGAPAAMRLSEVPGCVVLARAGSGPVPEVDVPDARFVRDDAEAPRHHRDPNYARRPDCDACVLKPVCSGAMVRYVERFGWDEFPPVLVLPGQRKAGPSGGGRGKAGMAAWLLDVSEEGLAKAGLAPAGCRRHERELEVSVRGQDGMALSVLLEPRDDGRPAYLRTRHVNVGFKCDGPGDRVPRLMARVARRLRDASWDEVVAAWERLSGTGGDDTPVQEDPVAALPLEESFGDVACGMMGALDVLREVPGNVAIVVHGDRGCLPTPEGSRAGACTSDLREMDVVGGGEARLAAAVAEVIGRRGRPEAVVIVSTCLSEVIGDDIEHVARLAEQAHGVPVVPIKATGLQPLRPIEIARRVHDALATRFLTAEGPPEPVVGFVGYPAVAHDGGPGFLAEVSSVLDAVGAAPGPAWPSGGIRDLARLARVAAVFAPERVVHRGLLERLEAIGHAEVVVHAAPFGVAACRSFYDAVGARAGLAREVAERVAPDLERAAARIGQFRGRHEGRRVAVCFGNNREGTSALTTLHLGVGYVPLLVEMGLVPVLVALTEDTPSQWAKVRELAARLGAAPEVHLHRRPEDLTAVLVGGDFAVASNEDCQKCFVDAAGLPFVRFLGFEPGLRGAVRAFDLLEAVLP